MKTATPKSPRSNNKHNHAAQRCAADRIANRQEPAVLKSTWELHIGIIQLIIIGPDDEQWFPASCVNYGGPAGTPEERMIAERAVAHLNANHPGDKAVTKSTITAILKESALGVTTL